MRKILIIGASSAIAQATARLFAQQKDALFLVGRNEEKLAQQAEDLRLQGAHKVDYAAFDLNEFEHHPTILSQATVSLNGLDTVLIAHGILDDQKAGEQEYVVAEEALRTNFLSVVSLLTPIANQFEQQRYGSIAVISSVAGDRGRQSNYIYGTAKGAVSIFLSGLRNRLAAANVNVLTIKPGFVDTPMTAEFKKGALWASPEQVAAGIHQGIEKEKSCVYLPSFWWLIMFIIRSIPESIFKRLKL